MKKGVFIIITILSVAIIVLFILLCLISVFHIGISQDNSLETFLLCSESPDGRYTLEAYRTEPGATVDFSIKVYLMDSETKKLIYNAYHEYKAEIFWIDDETVSINGKTLDLSAGEKYDWRTK